MLVIDPLSSLLKDMLLASTAQGGWIPQSYGTDEELTRS
jgi:hypothetical protein